jgi:hypothetical protein
MLDAAPAIGSVSVEKLLFLEKLSDLQFGQFKPVSSS